MDNRADQEMRYYPKESLCLTEDVPGARQWAVSLDQTKLTYFSKLQIIFCAFLAENYLANALSCLSGRGRSRLQVREP